MSLSGAQFQQLQDALLSAFPSDALLKQMVLFQLDENLDAIAGGGNATEKVFNLISWAVAQGRIEELINGAALANTGNVFLQSFVERYRQGTSADSSKPRGSEKAPEDSTNSEENDDERKGSPSTEKERSISLFYSYAHEDEDLRDELEKHLKLLQRRGIIEAWHDRRIVAGQEWAGQIDENLENADMILLLVSADFIASDYCWDKEMTRAMELHEAREAVVIPIIIRDVNWSGAPFDKLQALPKDAKAVNTWSNQDSAWKSISEGIEMAVKHLVS